MQTFYKHYWVIVFFSPDRNITPSPITPSPENITSSISEPDYNTSNNTSSLLTFTRNILNNPLRLAEIEDEISNNHAFALNNPLETVVEESASGEANQSSITNTPEEFLEQFSNGAFARGNKTTKTKRNKYYTFPRHFFRNNP